MIYNEDKAYNSRGLGMVGVLGGQQAAGLEESWTQRRTATKVENVLTGLEATTRPRPNFGLEYSGMNRLHNSGGISVCIHTVRTE